ILVLRSNGHGTFFGSLTPASYPNDLVVTDVDRDGYLDVLVDSSNTTATVVHGGRDGFNRTSTLPLPASAERTVGDVTGDGLDDLILGTIFNRPLEEFRVYPALASGGYAAPVVMSLPLGSNHTGSLAVGDFNGDGRGDL
ncbi:VCBS repeat-containing protein, partial [Streptomyces sp. S9]|nr:VCBS repeat-containing protein [Streptomyces sp. S9]